MIPRPRRNDSAMAVDVVELNDERHAVPTQTPSTGLEHEPAIERPRSRRCDDAHRELYRHHFPAR